MTRDKMKDKILDIIIAHDTSFAYTKFELRKIKEPMAEQILKLWEFGHTWEIKNESAVS